MCSYFCFKCLHICACVCAWVIYCVYICVCVCVYLYICIYPCACLCVYIHIYILCVHMCICIYKYTFVRIHICLCIPSCFRECVCVCVYVYIYIYIYTHTHIYRLVKLAIVVKGDPKAPFSTATTLRCRPGRYSFPGITLLYPWYAPYNSEC